jgi:gentisate 1,2-dioxygenase
MLNKETIMSKIFYEYTAAANPQLPEIPIQAFGLSLLKDKYGWIPFDLSKALNTPYPATGPSVLAGYIHVKNNTSFILDPQACAVFCYIMEGEGTCEVYNETFSCQKGDVLSLPGFGKIKLTSQNKDLVIYSVNDSPLLNRLHAAPKNNAFPPIHYKAEAIKQKLSEIDNEADSQNRNRDALIYGNKEVVLGRGMSPTVWAATVLVHPGEIAMPHRHNSIAVDIVLECEKGACTHLGWKLDKFNRIIDPIIVPWENGAAFVTPPGMWHSHHNKSKAPALVTAVQDATFHEYLHTLDIQFTHKRVENRI